jgi:hypothetical protein
MPSPTLKLDTPRNAQVIEAQQGIRIVRTGFIRDIDTTVPTAEIFAQAMATAGMPAYNSAFPGSRYPAAKLRQRIIDGIDGNNNRVNVTLIYETLGLAQIPVTFLLQRSTGLVQKLTERHPNGQKPMSVTWRDPSDTNNVVKRTIQVPYYMPFQRLIATGWYIGEPPASMTRAICSVNEAPWRGLPRGYWLYADESDITRDYGGSYTVSLEFC